MKRILQSAALCFFATAAVALADSATEKVQRALKDQGFYYGEITGQVDADTTAAIRRYQIRNGLKVTGTLDSETQKSLGVTGGGSAAQEPQRVTPTATPRPEPAATPPQPENADELHDDSVRDDTAVPSTPPRSPRDIQPGYAPGPRGLQPATSGIFDGTPYEVAPPDLQRRVIIGAQTLLARGGYYRAGIDGEFGPGTEFAVRAYQARTGLAPTGRLDMETLGALGLLPGQRGPGFPPGRRRFIRRPPVEYAPTGEPIYRPN